MRQKKINLTKEEKMELRQEKKGWNEFLRRMRKKDALIEETTIQLN